MTYNIGQVARMLGTSTSAIRYYEKEGLLPCVDRNDNGVRKFSQNDLEQLKLVECLKKTGMSLKDIRDFVKMTSQGDGTIRRRLALFEKQKRSVESQMKALQDTLSVIEYKRWFYTTARELGSTAAAARVPADKLPRKARAGRNLLKNSRE